MVGVFGLAKDRTRQERRRESGNAAREQITPSH
jgi:hypothetical protein